MNLAGTVGQLDPANFTPCTDDCREAARGAAVLSLVASEDAPESLVAEERPCRVVGFGPEERFVEVESPSPSIRVCGLCAGEWHLITYVLGEGGAMIGQGSTTLTIVPGDASW